MSFTITFEDNGLLQRLTEMAVRFEEIPQSIFDEIGNVLLRSYAMNFEVEGRPEPWLPSKRVEMWGGKTLQVTGKLKDSGRISSIGNDHVEVVFGEGMKWAPILNFGGIIQHPGSDKFQAFDVGNPFSGGERVFTHGTKPHDIPIPARRYVRFQDEDVDQITQLLGDYLMIGEGRFPMEMAA